MTKPPDTGFLYLNQEDARKAGLSMELALKAVEEVFSFPREEVLVPPKVVLDLDERRVGRIIGLPAYLARYPVCGMKWAAGFPNNPEKFGIPRGTSLVILNDSANGLPLAVMDCTLISALRTGAVVGVGAKYLANPDSEIAAMIGTGVINKTSALALKTAMPSLREIRAYDVRKTAAESYAKEMGRQTGLTMVASKSPEDCTRKADIIVTATTADEPIVKDKYVKEGSYFAHMGSYVEEEFEVILHSDKILVDEWEQVRHRGTPVLAQMLQRGLINDDRIYGDLHDVVAGRKPGRETRRERIFFSPIGLGSEDVAVAYHVYKAAVSKKIGTSLRLWSSFALG